MESSLDVKSVRPVLKSSSSEVPRHKTSIRDFVNKVFKRKEQEVTPEAQIQNIIAGAEKAVVRVDKEKREPGIRMGSCNQIPSIVEHLAKENGAKSDIYQVSRIHEALEGAEVGNDSFVHSFSILTIKNQKFLVDLSYVQFMKPKNSETWTSHRDFSDHVLAQALYKKGYVPFTDHTLQQYLEITTDYPSIGQYTKDLTTAFIDDISPIPREMDEEELRHYGYLS